MKGTQHGEGFGGRRGSQGELCWHLCKELRCSRRANAETTKSADATALFGVVEIKTVRAEVQRDLIILSDWRLKQQMQFTVDKGRVMNIGGSNSSCTRAIIGSKLAITM